MAESECSRSKGISKITMKLQLCQSFATRSFYFWGFRSHEMSQFMKKVVKPFEAMRSPQLNINNSVTTGLIAIR